MPELLLLVVLVVFVLFLTGFRVAQQYERALVFRFGRYMAMREAGLFWIIPLGVERAVRSTCASSPTAWSSRRSSRATTCP